jgi:hypothetical protein
LERVRVPSLRRHYPASTVLRTHPPSASAGAGPRGFAVGKTLPLLATVADFPCCALLMSRACCHHYPGGISGCVSRSLRRRRRPSPLGWRVGSHIRRFRGLLDVHSRCGPHGPLTPYEGPFLGVLQAIRRLLTRPKCFRLERELAGPDFHRGKQRALPRHTPQPTLMLTVIGCLPRTDGCAWDGRQAFDNRQGRKPRAGARSSAGSAGSMGIMPSRPG